MARSSLLKRSRSRFERSAVIPPHAIGGGDANVAGRTNVAAPWDDREAAEQFSAVVIEFSAAELAKAARRTKAAAKGWKDGSRAPSLASTRNMALTLPVVGEWLASHTNSRVVQSHSVDGVIAWAIAFRNAPGQDGAIARAVLREAGSAPHQHKDASVELD